MTQWLTLAMLLCLAGCNLLADSQAVAPTPDLPQVVILDPPNNRQIIEGVDFAIDILARDSTQGIAEVALLVDGQEVNRATPFGNPIEPIFRVEMNWLARGVGLHTLEAIAYRPDGQPSDPFLITVEVLPKP
jgi:hypothetical protein